MADLPWLPYDVEEWETRVRELRLSFADEGALMRLVRGTWAAAVPCSIADDADEFARVLGAHWKKAVPILRSQYTAHPDVPGLLRCAWLWDLYTRQLSKHLSYQSRGKMGGRPKSSASPPASNPPPDSKAQVKAQVSASFPTGEAGLLQNSTEVLSSAPPSSGHRTKNPASGSALAPVGATLRAPDGTGKGDQSARRRKLEDEYAGKLRERFTVWAAKHEEEARVLVECERRKLSFPPGKLTPWEERALHSATLVAWRALPHKNPIPSAEEWIADQEREWVPSELEGDPMGSEPLVQTP